MLNLQGYVESDIDLQHVSAGTFDTVGFWIGGQLCRKIWLHISKLVCNCTAVATKIWMAPCNNWSTRHYSSKCPPSCLNPLHTFELVLDFRAVTTSIWIAPDHNRPICQDRVCWTPFSWSWTIELSAPSMSSPQVTTDPSARIAPNAYLVDIEAAGQFFNKCWTRELSPP